MVRYLEPALALSRADLWERYRNLRDRILARVDRLTHRRARVRTHDRLTRQGRLRRILVICTGNICRSPYAAAALRSATARLEVESAGFIGPGRPADPRGAPIALSRGVDLSEHRSRLVTAEDTTRFDLFLVMTRRHRDELHRRFGISLAHIALLGDFDESGAPEREIADPYGQPDQAFHKAFDQIDRSIRGFSKHLGSLPDG